MASHKQRCWQVWVQALSLILWYQIPSPKSKSLFKTRFSSSGKKKGGMGRRVPSRKSSPSYRVKYPSQVWVKFPAQLMPNLTLSPTTRAPIPVTRLPQVAVAVTVIMLAVCYHSRAWQWGKTWHPNKVNRDILRKFCKVSFQGRKGKENPRFTIQCLPQYFPNIGLVTDVPCLEQKYTQINVTCTCLFLCAVSVYLVLQRYIVFLKKLNNRAILFFVFYLTLEAKLLTGLGSL